MERGNREKQKMQVRFVRFRGLAGWERAREGRE